MKRDLFQAMGTTVDVTAPTDDAIGDASTFSMLSRERAAVSSSRAS